MNSRNLLKIILIIGGFGLILFIFFFFQIIELKDVILNLTSLIFISALFGYFFNKLIQSSTEKEESNRLYKELNGFFNQLFSPQRHSVDLKYFLSFCEDHKKDLNKYFGFHLERGEIDEYQKFYFLRDKYKICYKFQRKGPYINYKDSGNRTGWEYNDNDILSKKYFNCIWKDIKNYVKIEFKIKL